MNKAFSLSFFFALIISIQLFGQTITKQGDNILGYSRGGDYRLNAGALGNFITSSFVVLGPGVDTSPAYVTYGFNTGEFTKEIEIDFRAGTDELTGTLKVGLYNHDSQSFEYVTMNNTDYQRNAAYTFNAVIQTTNPGSFLDDSGNMEVQFVSGDGWFIDWVRVEYVTAELELNTSKIEVEGDDSNTSFTIESNIDWEIAGEKSWFDIVPSSGTGNRTIVLNYDDNNGAKRSAFLRVIGVDGDITIEKNLEFIQYEQLYLDVDPGDITVSDADGNTSFTIESNMDWSITGEKSWFDIVPSSGTGNRTVILNYDDNNGLERSSEITVRATKRNTTLSESFTFKQTEAVYLEVSPSSRSFNALGENRNVSIDASSELKWTVSESLSWISVSPTSGTGNGSITITANENTLASSRSGTINVRTIDGNISRNISVSQAGKVTLEVSPSTIPQYPASGGGEIFSVTSNTNWNVSSKPSWITISGASGSGNDGSVMATASINSSKDSRSGTITVRTSDGSISQNISVSQAPQEDGILRVVSETISFSDVEVNQSKTLSYIVSGSNLSNNVSTSVPLGSGFQISTLENNGFTSSLTLNKSDVESGSGKKVYVRFSPTEKKSYIASVTHSTSGIDQVSLELTGNGVLIPTTSSIQPTAVSPQSVNEEYWVEVKVGSDNPIEDLFGVSFKLKVNDPNTSYIEDSGVQGDFLGSGIIPFFKRVDDQTVDMAVTRNDGGGVNGSGTVAKAKFISSQAGKVGFSIIDLEALDSQGVKINLEIKDFEVEIISEVAVWPGDTNNDGKVTSFDVLFVGQCYDKQAPVKPNNPGNEWKAYLRTPWECVFADANGDGIVDSGDVLPIGLNYGKTHPIDGNVTKAVSSTQNQKQKLEIKAEERQGLLLLRVESPDMKLSGISGSLITDISSTNYEIEPEASHFGENALTFSKAIHDENKIDFAISKIEDFDSEGDTLFAVSFSDDLSWEESISFSIYNIKGFDIAGEVVEFEDIELNYKSTSKDFILENPSDFKLLANYPNPFNPNTVISYSIPKTSKVVLSVYNLSGQLVATLVNEQQNPGEYSIEFNATGLSSGNYIYSLEANGSKVSRTMTLIK